MQEKYLVIPNKKDLNIFLDHGLNAFILPLKDYSCGFDIYYSIEEINEISLKHKTYVIMNKLIHKSVNSFKEIYEKFNKNIMFIVEDIGLTSIIDKERLVLFENHIESNYKAINFLSEIGINNVVINNDLTIDEIKEIRSKTKSKLYYFLINRNTLLYSKRKLVTNYKTHYNIDSDSKKYNLKEEVSHHPLMIREEEDSTVINNFKLFSANKYIDELLDIDYLIINTSTMSDLELKVTLEHYRDKELINILDTDYYFLENDIKYKVGDIK